MIDTAPSGTPAAARAERRLAMLDRAAEKCLAMIEAVPQDGAKESADTVAKLTRALRLTLALQAKLEESPPVRAKSPADEPAADAPDPFAALKTGKKARVRELVRDVIDRETPDPEDAGAGIAIA
jgi:hypothetical protein